MRIAITVWNDHLATVADFSRRLRLVDLEHGRITRQLELDAPGKDATVWVARLFSAEVTTLLCGTITRQLGVHLTQAGITVVDGCVGPVDEVLAAWQAGTLDQPRYRVPRPPLRLGGWK